MVPRKQYSACNCVICKLSFIFLYTIRFRFHRFFPLVNTVIAVVTFVNTLTIQNANRTRLKINTRVPIWGLVIFGFRMRVRRIGDSSVFVRGKKRRVSPTRRPCTNDVFPPFVLPPFARSGKYRFENIDSGLVVVLNGPIKHAVERPVVHATKNIKSYEFARVFYFISPPPPDYSRCRRT